jgi:hypothetical protein
LYVVVNSKMVGFGSQGWNLFPRGNVQPFVHPRGEHSLLLRRMEGRTEKFTPRG